jgi:hypothetical protein
MANETPPPGDGSGPGASVESLYAALEGKYLGPLKAGLQEMGFELPDDDSWLRGKLAAYIMREVFLYLVSAADPGPAPRNHTG